ncbi:platelet endothelial cell adhesion molecule isoform 3-T3 [Aulostomus maculatus]
MGPLLLFTYTLLSSWRLLDAQSNNMITMVEDVRLSIEPRANVIRGTNVTLRCKAKVISYTQEMSRDYTIYKDNVIIFNDSSSSSQDFVYLLPDVRVSHTGKYSCEIKIDGNHKMSEANKLSVSGLSTPLLHLNQSVVSEGEELKVSCTAPGETGPIIFNFYVDSRERLERQVNSDQVEAKLFVDSVGIHQIHCTYTVLVTVYSFKSKESNIVSVSVKELSITPILEIFPQNKIYEGDSLNIFCSIRGLASSIEHARLILSQGNQILSHGETKINHSMFALAKDSGLVECRLFLGNIRKVATKTVSVTELFSAPTLTMSPAEVFEKEFVTLTCKSEHVASEKLSRKELTYTLDPPESLLILNDTGVFFGKALTYDLNYTCIAQAKGIIKRSKNLTVRPKVSVSSPKIVAIDRVVLGKPFKALCQSDTGSLPINYTLLKGREQVGTVSVKLPYQQALFTVTIDRPEDVNTYRCEAKNRDNEAHVSKSLNATVTVPLSRPSLTVIPVLPEISEGDHLFLICMVKGTPPVIFKWYRVGRESPLFTTNSEWNSSDFQIENLAKKDSGTYYCEALNFANNLVRSGPVTIEVRLALWKKAMIGGFSLLVVSVLVVVGVLCFRSKRAIEDRPPTSVWSERPPEAADDEESSMVSNELDVEYTEVVHPHAADPARVPGRKGTDTVYSELQNSPHGAVDHHGYGSVEYAELNGEQPEINHYCPEVNNYQDLPVPVD